MNLNGILNSLISNQKIGRGFDIPWIGGSIYQWVEGSIYHMYGGQNTMGNGSKYHG